MSTLLASLQAADPTADFGLGIGMLALAIASVVLLVLGILLPWFVYRTASYARDLRDNVRRMAREMETIRSEVRAIANVTTGTEPPLG